MNSGIMYYSRVGKLEQQSHTVTSDETGQPKNSGLILRTDKRFIASPKCSICSGVHLTSYGCQKFFFQGSISQSVKLTNYLHLAVKLRKRTAIPPLLHVTSWYAQRNFYFYIRNILEAIHIPEDYAATARRGCCPCHIDFSLSF